MKKILALALLLTFKFSFAQTNNDKFTMQVVEPKRMKGESLGKNIAADPRITAIFNVKIIKSKNIKNPMIQILAPDGFKIGTCFLTQSNFSESEIDYYRDIEARSRAQWEDMKRMDSYKQLTHAKQ